MTSWLRNNHRKKNTENTENTENRNEDSKINNVSNNNTTQSINHVENDKQHYDKLLELSVQNIPNILPFYHLSDFSIMGQHVALLFESRIDDKIKIILYQLSRFLKSEWSVILYVTDAVYEFYKQVCDELSNGIQVHKLTYKLEHITDYNNILMDISFWKTLDHFEKVLIFQSDTMMYRYKIEQFYEYDYVGAPWRTELGLSNCVGNGGFSLRTISAMIDCLSKKHMIKIPHYVQYLDNATRLNGNQPEDVFYSQAMVQFGYKVPTAYTAQSFSIETVRHNDRSIGSHQLDRFAPELSKKVLVNSIIPYFIDTPFTKQNHRFGWNMVTAHLNSLCTNPNGILLHTWSDCDHIFNACKNIYKPWVGIFHLTPVHTKTYYNICNIDLLLQNNIFIQNLSYCNGIFTLSEYMQHYVKKMLDSIGFSHIKVEKLYHPVEFTVEMFNSNRINTIDTIISLGSQLRYASTIYKLKTNLNRIWLSGRNTENSYRLLKEECDEFGISITPEEINRVSIQRLPDEEYDMLLGNSFIIIDLYDASANNALIECIARNIPCFIRRLPAIEEYIGSEYPLLFNNINELESMLENKSLIHSAYEYLVEHHELKERLTMNRFIKDILNSEITKDILSI